MIAGNISHKSLLQIRLIQITQTTYKHTYVFVNICFSSIRWLTENTLCHPVHTVNIIRTHLGGQVHRTTALQGEGNLETLSLIAVKKSLLHICQI